MLYNKLNNLLGWLCFAIAATTYILTLEPSVSFWDCGEFISCAFRLQISHQPGYPLFAMIGKAFSLLSLGDNTKVAYFTNMASALASAATVMFLFWTITALAKKMLVKRGEAVDSSTQTLIMGAGLVGALAFAYTDTFWFSAVETIVFAQAALCVSVVFWAILKWEARADEPGADRYLILIAYVMGLSIGIHLLNLLTIPALTLVYYFRRSNRISTKGTVVAVFTGVALLAFVQFGIIQYTVKIAAYFDLFFVNTLKFGFGSGSFAFLLLLVSALIGGIVYSVRKNKPPLNLILIGLSFMYLGYGSFAMIPIRAHAGTNLNNSHPDNAFKLQSYLNREQYIAPPLVYGPYFDSHAIEQKEGATIYRKGKTQYEVVGKKQSLVYDRNTILPRIFSSDGQDPQFYKQWLQLGEGQSPNFGDNLKFMFSWQIYQMYARYFLWNFVGRYNDQDGQTSTVELNGNWTSGWFDGGKHLPKFITESNTYTPLYAMPLMIGLFGMFYHFKRSKKDAMVIALLYFFTGIAIVLYVNQPSVQPRERDYSYVASFYTFAIWIGLGVIGLAKFMQQRVNGRYAALAATSLCLVAAPVLMAVQEWGAHNRSTKMTPHDMASNYLNSCAPNAILFTYGDNDTYSLWYAQEVENIRPDVRLVNLSLFGTDWYIRHMKKPMNQSAPLPITMDDDQYKDGVRDYLTFQDAKIPDSVELKEIFEFMTSDDRGTKLEYESGATANYLPTKNFKLTVDPAQVIKTGTLPASRSNQIAKTMEWKYPSGFVTKENLAMIDILVHNNWKRPVYFTNSVPNESSIGLSSYLYNEGFAYRLLPLKSDTAAAPQAEKTNTMVMYHNMMDKFKWGNMKKATYLDQQSTALFYPFIATTFMNLSQNLAAEGHPDMALKALHRYDQVMPDIYPYVDVAVRKFYLADTALHLQDFKLANKMMTSIDTYVKEQLDFNYHRLQTDADTVNIRDVQLSLSLLDEMSKLGSQNQQLAVNNRVKQHLAEYQQKFSTLMRQ
ncbi:DUF2723 domain-containing protein [Mucilaginibacter galii]|uniref:Membrane protein n=1 Tax=Mucilaginibacter galii TaxID=2005073 RepID=A0A917J936_9SPHI|nr:DUF2723 domain-containing protein [Mucilaginibacter galii]GGI50412.1 membrane protein [Mucilaginibacter galii]